MSNRGEEAGTGEEPQAAKKQRKLTEADLGGPIEDEETARKKLRRVGFDPDEIHEIEEVMCPDGDGCWYVNPICYFAGAGDLKMCRYLVTRGATTRDIAYFNDGRVFRTEWCPMRAAARSGMKHVCQWLYKHGAGADICRIAGDETHDYPLRDALYPWNLPNRDVSTAAWLVLHGAIPTEIDGRPNNSIMEEIFSIGSNLPSEMVEELVGERKRLLQWAEEICDTHTCFVTFLLGTLPRPSERTDSAPVNQCLSGHLGIRKKITHFVGVTTGRDLRTVRAIIDPLKRVLSTAST